MYQCVVCFWKGGMQRQSQQVIWYNVQAMKMTDSKTDTRTGLPDAKATVRICEEFLARSMETNDLPGLAIGVSLGGEHWTGASGVRDVTTGDPLETGDVFHCGSLSKLFTSAAILKMIDSGVLRYEDRLMDVLPDVAFADERAGEIRLWQMLSHTSGIGDVANFRWHEALAGERALADYVHSDEVCKSPLLWAPGGGRFRYSNIAYDILGHIVSRKSADYRMKIGEAEEMSYEDFVEKYLIEPAGMVSSSMKTFERVGVEADEECPLICEKIRERNAADGSFSGWTPMALPHEKNEKLDTVPVKYYPYTRAHVPCSALTSPLEDLLKWGDIHVAGFARTPEQHAEGGIISADAYTHIGYEYATVPKIGEKMGLGWFMREQNGHRLYGHEGGEAGFRASFWICPELGMTIAVLSNLSGAPAKKLNIMLFDKLVRG